MMQEPPDRTWIVIIVAIIGAAGVIIAAITSPFATRVAERILPAYTPTVNPVIVAAPVTVVLEIPPASNQPTTGNQPTAEPQQQTVYNCPIYKAPGKGVTWAIDINVAAGEIAFIDAWGFDDRSGGVFVTITGPYAQQHTIHDGAFCGGIPANSNYEPVKEQRLSQMHEPFQSISLP